MTNKDATFEQWFDTLRVNVLEQSGVDFRDEDSVRGQYDAGEGVYDVIDEIVAEYAG